MSSVVLYECVPHAADMTDPADEQRVWLRAILERLKIENGALAQKAGLAQPTITRFLNDKTATHALSARTIAAIKRASGMDCAMK
jgi:plasmid maintenance system antidote protein VapI